MNTRATIAAVQADAMTQKRLRTLLDAMDIETSIYDSAESFLERAEDARPGCVIVDMELRGMSGMQLLERLRTSHPTLPIVLLADEPDVPMAVAAMRLGATDFIDKQHMDVRLSRRLAQLLHNGVQAHA